MPNARLNDLIKSYEERAETLRYKSNRDSSIGEATRICLNQKLMVLEGVIDDLKLMRDLEETRDRTRAAAAKSKKAGQKMAKSLELNKPELVASPDDRH